MNDTDGPLAALRDLHLPPAPGLWPPAPGWWLLLALLAVGAAASVRPLRRRMRRNRLRRLLQGELDAIRKQCTQAPPAVSAGAASSLLRRVALLHHPRHRVAALTGAAWLAFLRETGGDEFSDELGDALLSLPYHPQALGDSHTHSTLNALLDACEAWLRRNS